MSYPKPDPVGVWLVKWIVAPLIAIGLIGWIIHLEVMKHRCRKMAEGLGYIESTYIPASRWGFGEECLCRKKRNPGGTIDENAKLAINLD
jgi:hypothetical protein